MVDFLGHQVIASLARLLFRLDIAIHQTYYRNTTQYNRDRISSQETMNVQDSSVTGKSQVGSPDSRG